MLGYDHARTVLTDIVVYFCSTNMLEVTAALNAVCKLITEDMIPAVIGDVLNLLSHDMEIVRKKAVSAMHRFYQMDKNAVLDHLPKLRRVLCDKGT